MREDHISNLSIPASTLNRLHLMKAVDYGDTGTSSLDMGCLQIWAR